MGCVVGTKRALWAHGIIGRSGLNLFLVTSLVRNSHKRWFLHMRRQIVRLICSYQQAIDAPNDITGHTRRGATILSTCCAACSPFGTGKYGCQQIITVKNILERCFLKDYSRKKQKINLLVQGGLGI